VHAWKIGALGNDLESSVRYSRTANRATYLQVPTAEFTVVQHQSIVDEVWLCKLHIRIPALARLAS
jgi:hypothetical protein